MGKKQRLKALRKLGLANSPTDARKDFTPKAWQTTWDAAARLGNRGGLFWFPELDPKDQTSTLTRGAVNRNVDWLYKNVPPVRMLIDGLSLDEVDTGTWPKATTGNEAYDTAVTNDFHELNKDPRFFSSNAMENYYSAQWLVRRTLRLYGELFAQFLRPGEDINVPTVHFINPWQCDNDSKDGPGTTRREGVRRRPLGRPIDYRFNPGENSIVVPAEDVLYFHDQFLAGQERGISCLAPCARSLYRFDDIERAESGGQLMRTKMAYNIVRKDAGEDTGPMILPGASKVEEVDVGDGNKILFQRISAQGGDDLEVADVPAGFDLKVLESNRATITVDFLKWILNGASQVTLYPSEYVFGMSGLTQGTMVRLLQKRVQRVKNSVRQFQLVPQFCDRWYVFWLWQRIIAGAYKKIPGGIPDQWWKHKTIYPADDTVDVGREGRLYDERLETGKMSPEAYHGQCGEDASDVEDEVLAADLRRARKIKKQRDENPDLADILSPNPFAASTRPVVIAPPEPDPNAPPDPKPKK